MQSLHLSGGFVEVSHDKVTILSDEAELVRVAASRSEALGGGQGDDHQDALLGEGVEALAHAGHVLLAAARVAAIVSNSVSRARTRSTRASDGVPSCSKSVRARRT